MFNSSQAIIVQALPSLKSDYCVSAGVHRFIGGLTHYQANVFRPPHHTKPPTKNFSTYVPCKTYSLLSGN